MLYNSTLKCRRDAAKNILSDPLNSFLNRVKIFENALDFLR